ncbi:hypothetical protein KKF81_05775 [Candidatus Micrarchaeota archaeon]|nr:hypothetical protein [Candidatus Micrarchaeota archaeon]
MRRYLRASRKNEGGSTHFRGRMPMAEGSVSNKFLGGGTVALIVASALVIIFNGRTCNTEYNINHPDPTTCPQSQKCIGFDGVCGDNESADIKAATFDPACLLAKCGGTPGSLTRAPILSYSDGENTATIEPICSPAASISDCENVGPSKGYTVCNCNALCSPLVYAPPSPEPTKLPEPSPPEPSPEPPPVTITKVLPPPEVVACNSNLQVELQRALTTALGGGGAGSLKTELCSEGGNGQVNIIANFSPASEGGRGVLGGSAKCTDSFEQQQSMAGTTLIKTLGLSVSATNSDSAPCKTSASGRFGR